MFLLNRSDGDDLYGCWLRGCALAAGASLQVVVGPGMRTFGGLDVLALVEEVRATLAPMIEKKKHTFSIESEGTLPNIVADRFRLKQILINLASNACKFTQEEGQIGVRARVIEPLTFQLDVIDNGPGIALDDQALIFEEFRQARATRPGEGTGLGLAITRRLVLMHGGRIWVKSELGAGAVFTVLSSYASQ